MIRRFGLELLLILSVLLDATEVIKVTIEAPAFDELSAEAINTNAVKEEQRFTNNPSDVKNKLLQTIIDQRNLPSTRRFVFILDPSKQFAVREVSQSYLPTKLISRSKFTQFQEVGGRGIWLPRCCMMNYYTFYSVPNQFFRCIRQGIRVQHASVRPSQPCQSDG